MGGMYQYFGLRSYGSLNLTATSPVQSFTEPISLTEAKEYLNLPVRSPVDNSEDDMINGFITAARETAEITQGVDLVRKQWDLSFDYFWTYQIELRAPLVSVDLFQRKDSGGSLTAMVEGTDFLSDKLKHPGVVTPVFNTWWPAFIGWPTGAILIRFTSGYTATDAFWSDAGRRVKVGMLMLISAWYNNRLPFDAVRGISEYPFAVTSLLGYGAQVRAR